MDTKIAEAIKDLADAIRELAGCIAEDEALNFSIARGLGKIADAIEQKG